MSNRPTPRLDAARANVRKLWIQMCEHDRVPTDSRFVVFTDLNPFFAEYQIAVRTWQQLRKAQETRKARKEAIASLGMKEVRGALGGRYIE
jgi:hypothetical protein